jgi:poly-gamma-glutamate synthesis protein (capsule biosynthesis protein)
METAFADVAHCLGNADLSIVNLECPLTNHESGLTKSGPVLSADPRCAQGIRAIGFDIVALANNHVMDKGETGLADTLAACRQTGLRTVGAGTNLHEASRTLFAEVKGHRVAILAMAEHEFSIATENYGGAWPLDPIANYHQIRDAREQSDLVLVLLHGGNEFYPLPRPGLVSTCRYFVDVGANAVVCQHSHVASGFEMYRGAPIVYGTGNFLFDWKGALPQAWYQGYLVELEVASEGVRDVRFLPYTQSAGHPGVRGMSTEAARDFLSVIDGYSRVIADEGELHRSWEEFCRSKRAQYLSTVLCLTRVERRLLRIGIWPFWRANRQGILEMLNLFTCESHREVTADVLSGEVRKGMR